MAAFRSEHFLTEGGGGPERIISMRFFIQIAQMERCIDVSVLRGEGGSVPGVQRNVYTFFFEIQIL